MTNVKQEYSDQFDLIIIQNEINEEACKIQIILIEVVELIQDYYKVIMEGNFQMLS